MKRDTIFPSKYLKAADLKAEEGESRVVSISSIGTEEFQGGDSGRVLWFREFEKGLVLNRTNWDLTADILQEDDDDNWVDRKIRLVVQKVPFKGKNVDAIRVSNPDVPF